MIHQLNKDSFDSFVSEKDKISIVEFYRENCIHCKKMLDELQFLDEKGNKQICFGKVNASVEWELSNKFEIDALPTLMYFVQGEVKEQLEGYYTWLFVEANTYKLLHLLH